MTLEQMELKAIERMSQMKPAEQRVVMMRHVRESEAELKVRDLKKAVAQSDALTAQAAAMVASIEPKYAAEVQKIQAAAERAMAEAMRLQAEAEAAPEVAMRGIASAKAQAQDTLASMEANAAPVRQQLAAYTAFVQAYDAGNELDAMAAFSVIEKDLKSGSGWTQMLKNKLLASMLHGEEVA